MAVPGVALTRGFYPLHPTLPPYMVPCEEWERDTGWGSGTGGWGGERHIGDLDSFHPCTPGNSSLLDFSLLIC